VLFEAAICQINEQEALPQPTIFDYRLKQPSLTPGDIVEAFINPRQKGKMSFSQDNNNF
jgi:hypothetical protein